MSHRTISRLLLPIAIAMCLGPMAWGKGVSKPVVRKSIIEVVKISEPTTVNGTTLQPSEYRMIAKGDKLTVEDSKHKTIAESPISWKRSDEEFGKTKLDIDHGVLTKVNLGGTHEAVLLHNETK
jgi:hypothetical protein